MKKRLVLFDFDGTITTKDTLLEFIRFYHGSSRLYLGFLMHTPWLVLMKLKVIPNWRAKEKILEWFFKGETAEEFNRKGLEFCRIVVPGLIRPKAIEEIKKHLSEGAVICVVSASAENWVKPWCALFGLNCMATRLEVKHGKLTGKIEGINCYGAEKENRIKACYDLSGFDEIFAYGDSSGDLEMLALAGNQHYKPFRT